MGVSFDLNEALPNIGRPLSTRRNQRFLEECCEAEQCRVVRLFVTPTSIVCGKEIKIADYQK